MYAFKKQNHIYCSKVHCMYVLCINFNITRCEWSRTNYNYYLQVFPLNYVNNNEYNNNTVHINKINEFTKSKGKTNQANKAHMQNLELLTLTLVYF